MAAGDLHLINARLPLAGDDRWYELIAERGRWTVVRGCPGRIAEPSALSIRDRRSIGRRGSAGLPNVIDLEGRLALPGFADMHMHLDKALTLPEVGNASGTLMEAIANYDGSVAGFTKANIRDRIVRTALMGLSHGTIHMRSHLDMPRHRGREVMKRTVEAALEAREELKGRVRLQLFPMLAFDRAPEEAAALSRELIGLGMDGLGGCPHLSGEPDKDVQLLFWQASKLGVPIDLHTDETDDPSVRTVEAICRATIAFGFQGKVTAGHLCSMASMQRQEAEPLIALMAEARVGAVTLPAVNLYLQGRGDDGPVRRGVTRVKELLDAGVKVAVGSDNIQDPFHPFGRGDLLHIGAIAAYAAHMGAPADAARIVRMMTETPAALMELDEYGIRPGHPADLVVTDALTEGQLLTEESPSRWVAVEGTWVSANVKEDWLA
ncbi:amidohydrolase family protein [Paenibacillus arenilitoris]|uniref:Amidohydrolase family protein n=1 Tax=Paenibacillus arenilitoris TaxID=2772299 RepID=A0A927CIE1_9BACL|nr:amidohydrolase family protein [Paenibacillus arenilitoris]MBD2868664.1 amidohydrolase family protein [Paenibacillus arenilitoris]